MPLGGAQTLLRLLRRTPGHVDELVYHHLLPEIHRYGGGDGGFEEKFSRISLRIHARFLSTKPVKTNVGLGSKPNGGF